MNIELGKDGPFSHLSLQWATELQHLALEYHARVETTPKLPFLHFDAGEAYSIVDGAAVMSEQASFWRVGKPQVVEQYWWIGS